MSALSSSTASIIFIFAKSSPFVPNKTLLLQFHKLNFWSLKPLHTSKTTHSFARTFYKSPKSIEFQLSDKDDEEEDNPDYADDDEDIAADEYDVIRDEATEDDEEEIESSSEVEESKYEEFKWQRIERIRKEFKEFGDDILDVFELASVYPFRIDKFQRSAI